MNAAVGNGRLVRSGGAVCGRRRQRRGKRNCFVAPPIAPAPEIWQQYML